MEVLFICKGNAFRSQIAEALYDKLTGADNATSAGTYVGAPEEPEGSLIVDINKGPEFTDFMSEKGFDLRERRTVHLTPEMLTAADRVISMAEDPWIPEFLKNNSRVIVWDVADIPFTPTARANLRTEIEKVYSQIEEKVRKLISEEK